ncbi:hypothetical protein GCM10018779_23250 [Streptomyces griseocarneus]|nr:hypothetical protein GCM10018779_23250 [Streptomyces griseocarneus]
MCMSMPEGVSAPTGVGHSYDPAMGTPRKPPGAPPRGRPTHTYGRFMGLRALRSLPQITP